MTTKTNNSIALGSALFRGWAAKNGYTTHCDNCGKPIPLSEAGAICEDCWAEQEEDDTPTHLQLGELPHGGWRRS